MQTRRIFHGVLHPMPYIILTANGEELQRTDLKGAVVLGRSAECDVIVRDVLLSRKHCRLERGAGREKGRWTICDLDSRNGSHVNWKRIAKYTLVDGDVVRLGRTWLTFKTGAFVPASPEVKKRTSKLVRPADPHEALSGTVADFIYVQPEDRCQEFDGTPSPHGRKTTAEKGARSPLNDLSSSWDSIVATASRPKRMARPFPRAVGELNSQAHQASDMSLQAHPMQVPYLEIIPPMKRRANVMPAVILTFGIGLATLLVLVSGWVMTRG